MSKTVRTTLTKLRSLRRLVDGLGLDPDDKAIISALLSKEIARCERRQAKMLAKVKAAEAEESEATGPVIDVDSVVAGGEQNEDDRRGPRDAGENGQTPLDRSCPDSPETKDSTPAENKGKGKGHGRNGAGAYDNAEHIFHILAAGVIGSICQACGLGRMSSYREKLVVLIKGQPLFAAAVHHFEQARCKLCGDIIRAEGAAVVGQGLGSSYITYHWSACSMLVVMHYFAGMPFKRLESLQAAWGIPMPDANQWTLVDGAADLLLPLYNALERHGVCNATSLRIDDTGSMIIEVRREIRRRSPPSRRSARRRTT